MKEVEVKIKNINKDEIIKKIEELGAKRIFTGKVIDFRFDTPDRDLSRVGKALRIRQKGRYIFLNLKGKKRSQDNITGREEIGVKISNFWTMKRMLHELGYIKIFELAKYRTEYRLDDITFDIDEYLGLEPILEIESHSYERVQEFIDKLGIDTQNVGRVYIREILAARKKFQEEEHADDDDEVDVEAEDDIPIETLPVADIPKDPQVPESTDEKTY
jgi:predicted adenylyl cyclase CyaB